MRSTWDNASARLGEFVPEPVARRVFRRALGDQHVALCLHRVGERRPTDWQPFLNIAPDNLDALIDLLLSTRRAAGKPWLTVSFDDGYDDAARWLETRAARFPTVEFLYFLCPQKTLDRAGFRWDLIETRLVAGDPDPWRAGPLDVEVENGRPELRALAERAEFRLASLEQLKALQRFPNVALGNHTDCHFIQTELSAEQAQREYERSQATFTRLFGPTGHFAFPYGTPRSQFDATHVELVRRRLGAPIIWTTEPRPYAPGARRPGAVLPRFSPNGRWTPSGIAMWIAARALASRLKPPRGDYPLAA